MVSPGRAKHFIINTFHAFQSSHIFDPNRGFAYAHPRLLSDAPAGAQKRFFSGPTGRSLDISLPPFWDTTRYADGN
jgi:hypothetical protein